MYIWYHIISVKRLGAHKHELGTISAPRLHAFVFELSTFWCHLTIRLRRLSRRRFAAACFGKSPLCSAMFFRTFFAVASAFVTVSKISRLERKKLAKIQLEGKEKEFCKWLKLREIYLFLSYVNKKDKK